MFHILCIGIWTTIKSWIVYLFWRDGFDSPSIGFFFKPIVMIPIMGWMTIRTQSFKHFLNNALTMVHDAVVWYGLVWSGLILMWYGVVCLWYGLIWNDMIWCSVIWYYLIWFDLIWYDMIWYLFRHGGWMGFEWYITGILIRYSCGINGKLQ